MVFSKVRKNRYTRHDWRWILQRISFRLRDYQVEDRILGLAGFTPAFETRKYTRREGVCHGAIPSSPSNMTNDMRDLRFKRGNVLCPLRGYLDTTDFNLSLHGAMRQWYVSGIEARCSFTRLFAVILDESNGDRLWGVWSDLLQLESLGTQFWRLPILLRSPECVVLYWGRVGWRIETFRFRYDFQYDLPWAEVSEHLLLSLPRNGPRGRDFSEALLAQYIAWLPHKTQVQSTDSQNAAELANETLWSAVAEWSSLSPPVFSLENGVDCLLVDCLAEYVPPGVENLVLRDALCGLSKPGL